MLSQEPFLWVLSPTAHKCQKLFCVGSCNSRHEHLQGLFTLLAFIAFSPSGPVSYLKCSWGSPFRALLLTRGCNPFGSRCSFAVHPLTLCRYPLRNRFQIGVSCFEALFCGASRIQAKLIRFCPNLSALLGFPPLRLYPVHWNQLPDSSSFTVTTALDLSRLPKTCFRVSTAQAPPDPFGYKQPLWRLSP